MQFTNHQKDRYSLYSQFRNKLTLKLTLFYVMLLYVLFEIVMRTKHF